MSPVKELGWWIWGAFAALVVLCLIYPKETIAAHDGEIFWGLMILILGNIFRLKRRIRETYATKLETEMALILHPGVLVLAGAAAWLAWKQAV